MKVLAWLVATYGRESWTLRKNEEIRLDAFEMKGLRKILRFLWTAKKTNELVPNKAGVKRELLHTIKARKLAYYGHTIRKQGSCLEKEIMQGTMPGACRRGRPHTAWMDIKTWTGLPAEVRQNDRTEINGESMSMVWQTLRSRTAKEQNSSMTYDIIQYHKNHVCLLLLSLCFCFSGLSLHLPALGQGKSASALPGPRGGCLSPAFASPRFQLSLPHLSSSASAPASKKCLDYITACTYLP